MNASANPFPVRVDSVAGLLAVIPHLLGFTPGHSLVVIGLAPPADRVKAAMRYDLPVPPDAGDAAAIAGHAAAVLRRHRLPAAVAAGYGPGPLVTPVADALRAAAARAGVALRDVLRVEDGRYWSYLCASPSCCPAEGVPFDPGRHPASAAMAAAGLPVLSGREALAATVAPLAGPAAEAMTIATARAERAAARLTARTGARALEAPGLAAVQSAIEAARHGQPLPPVRAAWLALVLTRIRVRDDAWARMDPAFCRAHRVLWADLTRRALPGYVAAPACLLAVTAWQAGDGALANLALDRALADTPGYPMALLLRDLLAAGAPPSVAAPPMTPDEVAACYDTLSPGGAAGS